MKFFPEWLLRRLYQRQSLRNVHQGVRFNLKNRLSEAQLLKIHSLTLDQQKVPVDQVQIEHSRLALRASQVAPDSPLTLPLGETLQFLVLDHKLQAGVHRLEIEFESSPFGRLWLRVEDDLQVEDDPLTRVPRDLDDDYCESAIAARREFLQEHCGGKLDHIARNSFDPHLVRGNLEHFIGVAQVPLGVAGPLIVHGQHAQGEFYVPLATSEGTLVASYNRGMKLLQMAGGVTCTVVGDNMQRAPVFAFDDARGSRRFADWVVEHLEEIRQVAESTSRVARLKHIDYSLSNRFAYLRFNYTTGDAAGQNMVGKATFAACNWILENYPPDQIRRFFLESNFATDKKASMINTLRTRGKRVTAEATLPRQLMLDLMGVDTRTLAYHAGVANVGAFLAGANNNGLHSANALAALFIATGQDVANLAESSAAIVYTELQENLDLYFSITLPSLIVATYGGGTGLPTQRECLEMIDCYGHGKVLKFAEIVAGTVLAGELSLASAISSLDWVSSHERLGRNR